MLMNQGNKNKQNQRGKKLRQFVFIFQCKVIFAIVINLFAFRRYISEKRLSNFKNLGVSCFHKNMFYRTLFAKNCGIGIWAMGSWQD